MGNLVHSTPSRRKQSAPAKVSDSGLGDIDGSDARAPFAPVHPGFAGVSPRAGAPVGEERGILGDEVTFSHILEDIGYDRQLLLRYRNMQFVDADSKGISRNYQVLGKLAAAQLFEQLTNRAMSDGRLIDWESEPETLSACERSCFGGKAPSGHQRISVAFKLNSQSTYVCHVSRSSAGWPALNANALAKLVGALYLMSTQLEQARRSEHKVESDVAGLTAREIETLNWCKFGKTYGEIAAILGISSKTVKYHMSNVMRKLDVNDKTSAILSAASRGIINL